MTRALPWILFGVPAFAMIFCWRKLVIGWRNEPHTIAGVACLTFTSAAVLLALVALWWAQFVRPLPLLDYRVEAWGLLLSAAGVLAGLAIRQKHRNRYLGVGLAAAAWTSALFFIAGLSG